MRALPPSAASAAKRGLMLALLIIVCVVRRMVRGLCPIGVVVALVGCGGATSGPPAAQPTLAQPTPAQPTPAQPTPAQPTPAQATLAQPTPLAQTAAPAPTSAPTRLPLINVDDMMGMFPQQTVFVATPDHVSAITLLNHFKRYEIQTNGVAQLSADPTGQWLYLLDAETPGTSRLRGFEVALGTERARQTGINKIAADRRALTTLSDGRVLVLKSDADHAWVDAYAALTLRPLGAVMDNPGCGDRLLASARRIAIVCRATGEIAIGDVHAIDGPLPTPVSALAPDGGAPSNLVAAAMAEDGTLYVATADQHLAVLLAGATRLASIPWPSAGTGSILPEGLAVAQGGESVVVAERTDDGAWLRVFGAGNMVERRSLRLAGVPQGGIVTMWPFAYYAVESTIRHVDLTSGLLETMAEVGAGAEPGAVVNG